MVATAEIPIAKKAAALIEWTDPWFAVMVLLADLAKEKGLTREQVHFAVDFVLDDDIPLSGLSQGDGTTIDSCHRHEAIGIASVSGPMLPAGVDSGAIVEDVR